MKRPLAVIAGRLMSSLGEAILSGFLWAAIVLIDTAANVFNRFHKDS